jgi:hypothetical protein
VVIIIPKGYANLSSVTGAFQILIRANEYWQKQGNRPMMQIYIAGFETELKLDAGFFSIHPVNILDLKKKRPADYPIRFASIRCCIKGKRNTH